MTESNDAAAMILEVIWSDYGVHLVGPATVAAAERAQAEMGKSPLNPDPDPDDEDDDNAVEDYFLHTVAEGMGNDVPADVLDEFDCYLNLMFVDWEYYAVSRERLDEMIAVLRSRGFTVNNE